ncbi:hypothetical protein AURDEDRAFT_187340 [Auricularia subglabra TFB-10046 SS5]|nr:hypothetical protein AURDEDRAFT_187340 [Auricularia subglabra TFB-10046 SS5]
MDPLPRLAEAPAFRVQHTLATIDATLKKLRDTVEKLDNKVDSQHDILSTKLDELKMIIDDKVERKLDNLAAAIGFIIKNKRRATVVSATSFIPGPKGPLSLSYLDLMGARVNQLDQLAQELDIKDFAGTREAKRAAILAALGLAPAQQAGPEQGSFRPA